MGIMPNQHAEEWRTLIAPLVPIGEKMLAHLSDDEDALSRHELYQLLFSQIALGYVGRLLNDPDYPDFVPMYSYMFNQGFPNPDDSIYLTPIRGEGMYKIRHERQRAARHVTFQIGSGTLIPYGTGAFGPSLADYNIDTATIAEDGSFEVMLSAERPAGYAGDWWPLDTKATYIVVRQRAYDWIREVDGRFAIERLDVPAEKPRPDINSLKADLLGVSNMAATYTNMCLDGPWVKHLRGRSY